MSVLDCVKGKVSAKAYRELEDDYERLLRQNGMDDARASLALLEEFEARTNSIKKAEITAALRQAEIEDHVQTRLAEKQAEFEALSKPAQMLTRRLGREPSYANVYKEFMQGAANRADVEVRATFARMKNVFENLGLTGELSPGVMRSIVQGTIDGADAVTDPAAQRLLKEFNAAREEVVRAYRAQGGVLGEIEGYVPIMHSRHALQSAGKDNWIAAYEKLNDLNQITDFTTGKKGVTPERFREIASQIFDDIVSDGATRRARELEGAGGRYRRFRSRDVFARRMQARFTKPMDSAAYLAYNKQFGAGDDGLFSMFVNNVRDMAQDVGVMKVMGPMPVSINDTMIAKARAAGATAQDADTMDGMFRTMLGRWSGEENNTFTRGVMAMQNLVSSSLLGSAPIAALGDHIFRMTGRNLAGLNGADDVWGAYFKGLAGRPDEALLEFKYAETIMHTLTARFAGDLDLTGASPVLAATTRAKNAVHKVSGLNNITLAMGDMASLDFNHTIRQMVRNGTGWADVAPDLRNVLRQNFVSEQDWNALMKANVGTMDPVVPVSKGLPDSLRDLAGKIAATEGFIRSTYTNSPDLFTRATSTGAIFGSRIRGGGTHITASTVMQLKSFIMQSTRNHIFPSLIRAANGNLTPMGILVLGGLTMGSMVVQLQQLAKGQPTYDFDDPRLYREALLKSGVASILGDIILRDPDQYKRNLVVELIGPVPSITNDIAQSALSVAWAKVDMDETTDADYRGMMNAMKRTIPGHTIWYAKLALERMVFDAVEAAVDDGYYDTIRRRNRETVKEFGELGWWPEGR